MNILRHSVLTGVSVLPALLVVPATANVLPGYFDAYVGQVNDQLYTVFNTQNATGFEIGSITVSSDMTAVADTNGFGDKASATQYVKIENATLPTGAAGIGIDMYTQDNDGQGLTNGEINIMQEVLGDQIVKEGNRVNPTLADAEPLLVGTAENPTAGMINNPDDFLGDGTWMLSDMRDALSSGTLSSSYLYTGDNFVFNGANTIVDAVSSEIGEHVGDVKALTNNFADMVVDLYGLDSSQGMGLTAKNMIVQDALGLSSLDDLNGASGSDAMEAYATQLKTKLSTTEGSTLGTLKLNVGTVNMDTANVTLGAMDMTANTANIEDSNITIAENTKVNLGTLTADGSRVIVNHGAELNVTATGNVTNGVTSTKGAAILNKGSLTLAGGSFMNNTATGTGKDAENKDMGGGAIYSDLATSVTNINNVSFVGNSTNYIGGAVYVYSGSANISGSSFTGNSAEWGGAVYTKARPVDGQQISDLVINNSTFTNNTAKGVGAVGVMRKGIITNTNFIDNHATDATDDGAGALFLGAESYTTLTGGSFVDNGSAAAGGAIGTRDFGQGNNVAAKLDINGTRFEHNIAATTGGAIDNYFYNDGANDGYVKVSNATFTLNGAAQGGAIYNHAVAAQTGNMRINNSTFTSNNATAEGGAVYNEGEIALNGTNTFTGNTANGLANDIYNVGTLTVESGTTTMDGGIDGTGTLTVADGATLNIGTATINQGTITLDSGSTLIATLREGDSQLNASTAFSGDGTLSLVFSNAGTYHVFGNNVFASAKDQVKSLVYDIAWANNDKDLIASVKSVEDIAEANGIEQETAAAIVGLNTSTSEKLNDLGVKMQEKLAEATPEAKHEVEEAAKAIHPETESVTQSVATSVQTTVTNLASARMAAPTIGRNGGDLDLTSGGVWTQGLFNKSKQNEAFDGYTRGIAVGMDGTINKVWTIGAGYSYAHSDITGSARDTEIDSNTVFLYGQYKPAEWYVNAVLNYTMSDFSEEGTVMGTPVTGDYDVDSYGATVTTGYDFASGITPELGLRYMHVDSEAYTNSLGVKTSSKDTDFLTGILGAKYAFNVVADKYTTFVPQLNAGLRYDILSDKNVSTVAMPGLTSYTLNGERLSRFGGEFGIGLGIKHRSMEFSVNYDIDVRKDYTSQTGMLKFRYNF